MLQRHAIEMAFDLVRMPALARIAATQPVPHNVSELMRIAAGVPTACQAAAEATGKSEQAVIEAARFYLQQVLLRPDADCYRTLGIWPGVSRATAQDHMRWLLKWLHPDQRSDLDGVYAERVLKAWREVSSMDQTPQGGLLYPSLSRFPRGGFLPNQGRVPWIELSFKAGSSNRRYTFWLLTVGLITFGVIAYVTMRYLVPVDATYPAFIPALIKP